MELYSYMNFYCSSLVGGVCVDPSTGAAYECINGRSGKHCYVSGRTVLEVTQGIGKHDSPWYYVAYLACIYFAFKTLTYVLINVPWERGLSHLRRSFVGEQFDESEEQEHRLMEPLDVHTILATEKGMEGPSLCWSKLSVKLKKNGNLLIDDCSGYISSGKVLALMGPSGAGKTTLLNALAQRADYAFIEGRVLFNGRKMTPADLTYVPQFDDVNLRLTVYEHLRLVGALTCADDDRIAVRLEQLLIVLGLSSIKDHEMKRLSGGEVKRVRIGIGLMTNPKVLFLDGTVNPHDDMKCLTMIRAHHRIRLYGSVWHM